MVGVLTLLGYALDVRRLTDWDGNGISMFPNAAVCAALSGLAILLLTAADDRKSRRIVVRVTAGIVGLVGGLTLLEHLASVDLGIDTLLFHRSWGQRAAVAPMRMGPPASSSYLIIGTGLFLATHGPRARRFASALAIGIVGIASLSLVGYWFGANQLFGVARFTGIAVQTSSALAAIGIGLIASLPEHGLAAMLRRDDPGGVIVRRLLLPILAISLVLGWLRVLGQEAGYFDTAFGTALLSLVMIAMFGALLWWTAKGVSRQAGLMRAAEESVRDSEARHRSLFEVAVYGVLTIDENGIIQSANPAAERLFGYSSREMIGRNVSMLMPEPFKSEHDSYLQKYLRTGMRKIIGIGREVVGRRKDGSTFPMDLAVAEFQLGGKRYFKGMVHDVSERRRAEEALRESREGEQARRRELEALLEAAPAIVWIAHDRDCKVITGNRAAAEFLKMLNDKNMSLTAPGNEAPRHFQVFRNGRLLRGEELSMQIAARTGKPVLGDEVEDRFDDGTSRFTFGNAVPLFDEHGQPRGAIGAFVDITERKRQEEELRASEARFRQLAEAMPQIVWVADSNGHNVYLNSQWSKFTGRTIEEGLSDRWAESIHPDDLPGLRAKWEVCVRDGTPYVAEYRLRGKDGAYRWHIVRGVPIKEDGGRVVCWYGSSTDMDEPKRLAETLQEADRRKDEFLATLAHELRNPLAPIRNALELMRWERDNPTLIEQARAVMERQVSHVVRLVDDLLDVSRITQGRVQLRKERVELAAVVQSAVEASRPLIETQGHELIVTLPPVPVYLDADPTRLAQVFANLLNNAAKYSEKGGRIWLTAAQRGGELTVSVRDTGIGIAAEHLPHIFEMFSQIEPALERSQGGLGIGLALVRGLVELHGGTIEARSAGIGKGSEFILHLPGVGARAAAPLESADGDQETICDVRPTRILVVDDNRDAADSLATMLRMTGHQTETAYDGQEAIQAAATFRPQVVLLDIGLPSMNGYEAARHIREQPWGKGMALIALTGWGQEEDKRRALEAGFDYHLTKPVEAAALERLVALMTPVPQR
jgi:PAS domain S-box-containing protein